MFGYSCWLGFATPIIAHQLGTETSLFILLGLNVSNRSNWLHVFYANDAKLIYSARINNPWNTVCLFIEQIMPNRRSPGMLPKTVIINLDIFLIQTWFEHVSLHRSFGQTFHTTSWTNHLQEYWYACQSGLLFIVILQIVIFYAISNIKKSLCISNQNNKCQCKTKKPSYFRYM